MKLHRITDNTCYIDAAVNLGLITKPGGQALLIDTGIDASTARKIRRLLEENDLELEGIVITHAHADHSGGADYLVKTTGAPVYASPAEKTVLEFPLWEPVYLFGGAYPPLPLRSKFFLAPRVEVDRVITPGTAGFPGFEDLEIEVVDLAGHTLGQVGVAVDGVLFCADAVIAPEFIAKHGVPLNAHLGKTLETYDCLEGRKERRFLPSHGQLVHNLGPCKLSYKMRKGM